MRRIQWLLLSLSLAAVGGCENNSGSGTKPSDGKLKVYVSILPQQYFVQRIGGDDVAVEVLIGRGQSEHNADPSPQQMVGLGAATAYFSIGVSGETRFLQQAQAVHKHLKFVDTRAGITLREFTAVEGGGEEHAHEPHEGHEDCDHGPGAKDPHIWLDPRLVKVQAATICKTLSELAPDKAEAFAANLAKFESELDEIDSRIAERLRPHRGKELFVFHPSYGYFAERYGLIQFPVERGGKEPTLKEAAEQIAHAKASGVRVVFYQPQFSRHAADQIARAIGGEAQSLDPLAEDYLKNLEEMAAKIDAALAQQNPPREGRTAQSEGAGSP